MILDWLKKTLLNQKKQTSSNLNHQILGTNLKSPLKKNEGEIIFGCGCFWGAEKAFLKLPGVITTSVGYSGGDIINPTYNQVCSGITGHTEVVRVTWDKRILDISDLLKLFWECHDPTQGNRQGNDVGSQYRSAIFTMNADDLKLSLDSRNSYQEELTKNGFNDITTEISKDKVFYYAENYHQQYLAKPGARPYCSAMPTNIALIDFPNSNFKLDKSVWDKYDWSKSHCILRSDNYPINVT